MIKLTEEARTKISDALDKADPPRRHLRIRASVEAGAFAYHLEALTDEMVTPQDTVLDQDGFHLVLDPESAERLTGTRIDYRETLVESGFQFDNPNRPASPSLPTGERTDLEGSVPDRVRMLLDTEINPAIATHGGIVSLVDVKDNRVYLAFGGGCHGCGMVDVTLKQGIETRIREAVPEVAEVVDTTDHATGVNPYYA
ncbi:MAG: NifU family protein [Gemmatimonadetes bacterium]|nr:NifU family protein [Gemmatimonadota bacterium]